LIGLSKVKRYGSEDGKAGIQERNILPLRFMASEQQREKSAVDSMISMNTYLMTDEVSKADAKKESNPYPNSKECTDYLKKLASLQKATELANREKGYMASRNAATGGVGGLGTHGNEIASRKRMLVKAERKAQSRSAATSIFAPMLGNTSLTDARSAKRPRPAISENVSD
jgi:hypothetical protein